MFAKQLGIDLGTVNVLVCLRGRGVVLQEPSVVAISAEEYKIVAVGEEAKAMLGRTPDAIDVVRPMRDGVIANYRVTHRMLQYFIRKACGGLGLFKPRVMISVPYGVTSVEKRAVREAALDAGAGRAHLIPEPLAGAIGAGLPTGTPSGNMVVDMGGGASEAAVVAMNGIVVANSVRVGGLKFDEVAGLPRTVTISSEEVTEALADPLSAVITVVKSVLEKTPPELSSDIIDRGLVLIGGGALLRKVDELITRETGVPAYIADAPVACVSRGALQALEEYEILKRSVPDL
jgi:rod shape-determining protein MreB